MDIRGDLNDRLYAMWPQLFTAAAVKLSFARSKVCSTTNQALASAHHLSSCSLNFDRELNDFGQHTGVLEEHQKNLALRHRLVRIDPTNAQWRYDEACILDQMGYEYRKAGFSHEAIAAYEVSAVIWRQLARTDPRNRELDLSISLGKLGDAKLAIADTGGAIAAHEEGAVNWRRILKRDPDNCALRVNLAGCFEKIGDLKFKAGDNTGALAAYEEVVAICRELDEIDGSNTQRKWNLSLRLDRIGDVELALGHINAAACAYEESLALRRSLAETNTSNSRWQGGVSLSFKKISNLKHAAEEGAAKLAVQRELQDIDHLLFEIDRVNAELQDKLSPGATDGKETISVPTRSLATIEESLTVSRRLAASDTAYAKYQGDLLADLEELAQVRICHGDPVEALSVYEESLTVRRRLAHTDQNDEQLQRDLCIMLEKVGDLRQANNDHAAAIALYDESLCIRRRLVAQNSSDTPGAPNAAPNPAPTLWTNFEESEDEGGRCATTQDHWDLVLTLKNVASARLNACDNPGALVALEESLALARQLLEKNKTSHISAAVHSLARSLSNTSASLGHQFARYRKETSALLAGSAKAWVAQNSQRAAKRVRLATRLIRRYRNEPSALLDRISATARAAAQCLRRGAKTGRLAVRQISRGYRRQTSILFNKITTRSEHLAKKSLRCGPLSAFPPLLRWYRRPQSHGDRGRLGDHCRCRAILLNGVFYGQTRGP